MWDNSSGKEIFANPYLVCDSCKKNVTHRENSRNQPCGHGAGFTSVCPSWSPVDGCQCMEHLGSVEHSSFKNIFDDTD